MKRASTDTLINKKKVKETTLIQKVIILLTLGFMYNLFFSCTPYSQDPIGINYNNIRIVGVDNSNKYLYYYNKTDTIYSDAVALKLTLADTSRFYATSFLPNLQQTFSFQTVEAKDPAQSFIPLNKVVDIKVKTLLDINDSIKAGDDISEHILCTSRNDFDLYHNLNQGILWLNGIQSYGQNDLILVLKTTVNNTNAQFEVKVTLDNGNVLSGTTERFKIIESQL